MNCPTMTTGAILGRTYNDCEAEKSQPQSQIDELMDEHEKLISQLSDEIYHTAGRFSSVLLPDPPTMNAGSAGCAPAPARSPLGYSIKEQSERVRQMLSELRSINNRSTVAP